MRVLILEDNEDRIRFFKEKYNNHILYITKDIEKAKNEICYHEYDMFFLDHDLSDRNLEDIVMETTGYDFCKWITEHNYNKNSVFFIHSMNPGGANAMLNLMKENGYKVDWLPFYLLKQFNR